MHRSLLALLAVLVVGLAVLFSRPWLYVVTGVILAGALGLLGWWLWSTYATDEPERPRPSPEPDASDPSLDEMGIVDIQPETADADLAQEEPTQEDRTETEPVESSAPSAPGPALATQKPSADQDETTERPTTTEAAEA
ncbi:MAG: GGDEF domain-containing protein, partial [Bacteroidetes bacterium QS_4_64_154]